jgi:squalene synthase HpnC
MSEPASALQSVTPPGDWSVARSFHFCQKVARRDTHNFPVATWLMPASVRQHAACLYAFARLADNFADEPRYAGQRRALLDAWSAALEECYAGRATHPVFIALRETVSAFDIPHVHLRELLEALRQDLAVTRYATRDDLLNYCRGSANSAGRLVLILLGYRDEREHRLSDAICTGHALVNFWQEASDDWKSGRIYIPQEDLARFGCDPTDLAAPATRENFVRLMEDEIEWTRQFFQDGWPLCERIHGRLGIELRLIWWSGYQALKRLQVDKARLLERPSSLTALDKVGMVWHAWMGHHPLE